MNIHRLIHYFVERFFTCDLEPNYRRGKITFRKMQEYLFIYLFSQRFVGLLSKSVGFLLHDMPYFFYMPVTQKISKTS